jgi:hypothetical protein
MRRARCAEARAAGGEQRAGAPVASGSQRDGRTSQHMLASKVARRSPHARLRRREPSGARGARARAGHSAAAPDPLALCDVDGPDADAPIGGGGGDVRFERSALAAVHGQRAHGRRVPAQCADALQCLQLEAADSQII